MRILYITPYVPSLIRVRPYNLIKYLSRRGHLVTVLSLQSTEQEKRDVEGLRNCCHRIDTVRLPRQQSILNCFKALPTMTPLQAAYCHSPAMQSLIRKALEEEQFDIVHVEHLRGVHFGTAIAGVPKVYDSVDCISLLFEKALHSATSLTSRLIARLDLGRTRRYEGRLISQYDKVLVTSTQDKEALLKLDGRSHDEQNREAKIFVLPNGVYLEYFAFANGDRAPETLVFSGKMSYHANVAAVSHMVQEVMPLVWARRPGVKLEIVGKNPPQAIFALAKDDRVHVTGFVPDLRPYLAQATVSVSPMQYSVGIQNKVLEAMAMGAPVVTTPQTRTAILAREGEHFLIGESAADFAAQVIRLLNDRELAARIGAAGRQYVEEHHDWNRIAARLEEVYHRVVAER
jgi:sugar transferase (PEP-CTERM/EpsH1 system associated)